MSYFEGISNCLTGLLKFLVPFLLVVILIRFLFRNINREIFRKLLHMIAFLAGPVMYINADSYWSLALSCLFIIVFILPVLIFLDRFEWFSDFLIERKKKEIISSFLILFINYIILYYIGWQLADKPQLVSLSILMWGFGDAAAALGGKRFGKTKVSLPLVDNNKTYFGSACMFVTSLLIGFLYLKNLLTVFPAFAGCLAELMSKNGNDTFFVPLTILLVLLLLF